MLKLKKILLGLPVLVLALAIVTVTAYAHDETASSEEQKVSQSGRNDSEKTPEDEQPSRRADLDRAVHVNEDSFRKSGDDLLTQMKTERKEVRTTEQRKKANWKNCSEDIWYATRSKDYKFYPERVMIKRKVIAPYKVDGTPKDWEEAENGNFRLTHPSNLWTDISIPFWSMPENTDHPTQKPEKLIAKLILASSDEGDFVFDPFLGSGTTSVVAKKLNRLYGGIELDERYSLLAEKRLELANSNKIIQGYHDGVFWERNSLNAQKQSTSRKSKDKDGQGALL